MARKLVIVGLCSLAFALTLLIAHATRRSESFSSPAKVEAEILVLRHDGFHPREIKRPPGKFLLALQNQSTAEELSLTLTPEGGNPLKQVRFENKQSKLREVIQLPPGRYVLSEANHPAWTCSIEIASH